MNASICQEAFSKKSGRRRTSIVYGLYIYIYDLDNRRLDVFSEGASSDNVIKVWMMSLENEDVQAEFKDKLTVGTAVQRRFGSTSCQHASNGSII